MGAGCSTKTATVAAASAVLLFAAAAAAAVAAAPAHAAGPYAQADYPGLGVRVQTVADGLAVPWSIDWLPDGTAIFTERGGTISVIRDGLQEPEAVLSIGVGGGAEGGLLGIAVDPDFEDNGYVYLYYTYNDPFSPPYNRIERYTYHDGSGDGGATAAGPARLDGARIILDKIPASSWHDGGRIQFGPDGMLYAATGDAIVPDLSQDAASLAGKILRMDRDGGAPADNPWEGSLVYSMGHRNPQGMDWDYDGRMIITEHGPSGRLGVGHDEINVVESGRNYGWPVVIGDGAGNGGGGGTPYENPAFHTGGSTWAPSGAEFYESGVIPEWQGRYFVATLLGRTLQMVQLGPDGTVASHEPLFEGEFGRLRDVQTGPDGHLYVLTSNRDGRGAPAPEDDRILRIVPLYEAAHGSGGGDVAAPEQQQQLRVLTYDGPETADTGPLVAALRHPGYEASPLAFDIGQKSLGFGFERSGAGGGPGHGISSLSLYVQRPLVSAPFEVVIYDESGGMVPVSEVPGHAGYLGGGVGGAAADPAAVYAIRHGPDHYVITIGTGLESGRVAIIGAHVVPEYPGAVLVMAVAAVAVAAAALALAAAPPSLAHGVLRAARGAGARSTAGCP